MGKAKETEINSLENEILANRLHIEIRKRKLKKKKKKNNSSIDLLHLGSKSFQYVVDLKKAMKELCLYCVLLIFTTNTLALLH